MSNRLFFSAVLTVGGFCCLVAAALVQTRPYTEILAVLGVILVLWSEYREFKRDDPLPD
jgi:hypothetical protein